MSGLQFVLESAFDKKGFQEPKLRRAKRACDFCKYRKARCSGTIPCDYCISKNVECVYQDSGRKKRDERKTSESSHTSEHAPTSVLAKTSQSSQQNQHVRPSEAFQRRQSAQSTQSAQLSRSNQNHSSHPNQTQQAHPILSNQHAQPAQAPLPVEQIKDSTLLANSTPVSSDYFTPQQVANPSSSDSPTATSSFRQQHKAIKQPYFRWLGPTAIAPPVSGTFRLLSVNLTSPSSNQVDSNQMLVVEKQDSNDCFSPDSLDNNMDNYVSEEVPLPPPSLYKEFYQSIANHVPFLPYDVFKHNFGDGVACECVLYAMGAMAQRVVSPSSNLAEKYADMAKKLVIPHLAAPSPEIVFALLLLAYLEFAHDRDSGLWAWSGMAIRMCYDLGLHKVNPIDDPFGRKVFWSVVCLDRLISCGTGRKVTIPDDDIEHSPDFSAVIPGTNKPDPFPYLCRLMILLGKVSNCFNIYAGSSSNPSPTPEFMDQFAQFQLDVSEFYTSLPSELLFDVGKFQEYTHLNYSQVFLMLHIWNQALVLAVHHPSLVYPRCQLDSLLLIPSPYAHLTGTGAISVADMITFADLIDSKSFLASPFLSQPIYMAACAALSLWKSMKPSSPSLPVYTLQRTYNTCRQTLDRMQKVWNGISWHTRTLDSLVASEADVDLSVGNVNIRTEDLGVLRKASIDESTRKWVAEKVQADQDNDIYGLFISGSFDTQAPLDFAKPMARPVSGDDNFRNVVIRGLDLDEFFEMS